MRIADMLLVSRERYPEKVAIRDDSRCATYRQLSDDASYLAGALQGEWGIKPGDHIAVWSGNCIELVEIIVGANLIGAVVELYNARWSVETVAGLVECGGVKAVFVGCGDRARQLSQAGCTAAMVRIGGEGASRRDEGVPEAVFEYEALVGRGIEPVFHEAQSSDIALDFFTSGTTGTPKCVEHTNASIVFQELSSSIFFLWQRDDVMLINFPLYHTGGLAIFAALLNGATVVLSAATHAPDVARIIEECKVTRGAFVPVVLQRLLQEKETNPAIDLSSLRLISYASARMSPELLRKCRETLGCKFLQAYGMTETASTVTVLNDEDHMDDTLLDSVGKPVIGVALRIVREDGSECAAGETGEVVVRSCTTMRGYRRDPQRTAEVLEDGWYYTRDLGFLDDRGYLHIRGRKDDMIISGGENIFPQEIRDCIASGMSADVAEVAVVGVADEKWGQCPVAFVVRRPGSRISPEDVRTFCGEHLGGFKRPKHVHIVEALPRNATSKIVPSELVAMHERLAGEGAL